MPLDEAGDTVFVLSVTVLFNTISFSDTEITPSIFSSF